MKIATQLRTNDGLTIYDLDSQAGELWAVAGPAGYDPARIDPDALPEGFRWIANEEWGNAQHECPNCGHTVTPQDDAVGCGCHCPECGDRL